MTVRDLDTATLKAAARDYVREFLRPTVANPYNPSFAPVAGRGWVMHSIEHFHFEDEFKYFISEIRGHFGPKLLPEFDEAVAKYVTPYDSDELEKELAERLAITPAGKPIPNRIGKVQVGSYVVGYRLNRKGMPRPIKVHLHIGESRDQAEARTFAKLAKEGVIVLPLVAGAMPATMALNTRISNEAALGACDYVVDRLDEGSGAAVVQGRSGAQPADPDTAVTGTLLFTLVCSDPAFGAASDANPGGRATASAVTNDSSADATATLGYCRASATNDGATPLDDHIDGEAGTSGADFNFNTLAIVSGATVSLTAWTVMMPES